MIKNFFLCKVFLVIYIFVFIKKYSFTILNKISISFNKGDFPYNKILFFFNLSFKLVEDTFEKFLNAVKVFIFFYLKIFPDVQNKNHQFF